VVEVSHADRVVYPDDGITKGELVGYYERAAPLILPHVRRRPLTLQRWPQGVGGPGFFTKERPAHFPDFVGAATVPTSESVRKRRGGDLVMTVVDTPEALVYVANQGMITPHVWLSTVDRPGHPDRLVVDLDPGPSPFRVVQDAAFAVRDLLESLGLVPFVKTTGSSGLHVEVPLDASAPIDEVRAAADTIAAALAALAAQDPEHLTTEFSKADRKGRLYLDVARNGHAQTEVAAYGVRGLPGAPVATPLEWDEVGRRDLTSRKWTIRNLFRRLARRPDPWAAFADAARPLPDVSDLLDRVPR
jgi:bifunctional non-homologous end joining protein LigD